MNRFYSPTSSERDLIAEQDRENEAHMAQYDWSYSPPNISRRRLNRFPRPTSRTPSRSSSYSPPPHSPPHSPPPHHSPEEQEEDFDTRWFLERERRDRMFHRARARLAGRRNKKTKAKPKGRKIKQKKSRRIH